MSNWASLIYFYRNCCSLVDTPMSQRERSRDRCNRSEAYVFSLVKAKLVRVFSIPSSAIRHGPRQPCFWSHERSCKRFSCWDSVPILWTWNSLRIQQQTPSGLHTNPPTYKAFQGCRQIEYEATRQQLFLLRLLNGRPSDDSHWTPSLLRPHPLLGLLSLS